ncbi:GntR family transcriptional regulator (plasmid) [Deinococcus wulumuqiensis R12]|nr:GntR family transcriptional regulator [Deinococcus wulumuqiensis R12]
MNSVRSQTTAEAVAVVLREVIHQGNLSAGEPLRTAHIAAELGVSRIPVREAL